MKLLITLAFDGDRTSFLDAAMSELPGLIDRTRARRGAIDLRAEGAELAEFEAFDTEREATAVLSLWEPASPAAALAASWPAGSRLVGAYATEELVRRDYERTWGTGESSPGVKLVCFVKRRPDLTRNEYSAHWRDRHGPLALQHQPGFWRYVQNHIIERLTDDSPDFDGIGELHFRRAEDVHTGMFDSDEGMRLIMEDTERFLTPEGSTTLPTKEYLVP